MDPLLEIYLERSLAVLLSLGGVAIEDLAFTDESENEATLRATIRFADGSRLRVKLTVDELEGFPSVNEYRFHYMTAENVTIFRYDNSDYHPDLPHAPHHKHEGADERAIGCPQPSLHDIRDEIAAYLKSSN